MATFSLSGTGTHTLSAGTTALHVTITTLPASAGHGDASPADYYGVGLLRLGDGTAYWDPYPVSGGPQWLPVPYGASVVGYSLLGGAVISITEVTASSPLAVPLSGLPDVAIGSPADTQVLTYQGSSGHWINAAAPSGGGGGTGIGQYRCSARRNAGVSHANNVTILVAWDTSLQDTDSMLQVGGAHPNRITVTHAGLYLVLATLQDSGGGGLTTTIAKNTDSTSFPSGTPDQGGAYVQAATFFSVQSMAAGDWLSIYGYMGTGSGTTTGRVYVASLF